ncbi:MAG TPA: hypothetical protein VEC12_09300 [Bacteroidia bacterium]|nr:hypothetical protein [Bacteroidia bacterium]
MNKNKLKFEEVWLAKHERAMSISKTIVVDDRYGVLTFDKEDQTFSYKGKNLELKDCKILGIVLKNQKLSIIGYAKYALIVFILFSLKNNILYGIIGLLIGLLLALPGWYFAKWIVIEYEIPNENKKNIVWFFDGSYIGWGGLLGGSRKMYNKIIDFFEIRKAQ